MKNRLRRLVLFVAFVISLTGCAMEALSEVKQKELPYEIVHEFDIPEEMKGEIKKQKKKEFWFAYGDKGVLYLARGYGQQESSGYEIEVKELYESENAIVLKTQLNGPDYGTKITKGPTAPYIVLKMKDPDKYIIVK